MLVFVFFLCCGAVFEFKTVKMHIQSINYKGYTLSVYYVGINVGYYNVQVKNSNEIIWVTKNRVRKADALTEARVWIDDKVSNDKAGCDLTGF